MIAEETSRKRSSYPSVRELHGVEGWRADREENLWSYMDRRKLSYPSAEAAGWEDDRDGAGGSVISAVVH